MKRRTVSGRSLKTGYDMIGRTCDKKNIMGTVKGLSLKRARKMMELPRGGHSQQLPGHCVCLLTKIVYVQY